MSVLSPLVALLLVGLVWVFVVVVAGLLHAPLVVLLAWVVLDGLLSWRMPGLVAAGSMLYSVRVVWFWWCRRCWSMVRLSVCGLWLGLLWS